MREIFVDHISLRIAEIGDGPFVLWLEEVSMKEYAIALWGEWHPSTTLERLDLTNHQIIEYRGTAVGCISVNWSKSDLHLARLFIDPAYRNKGIGTWVLRKTIHLADEHGLPVRASVLVTNRALDFYLREGFRVESETSERRKLLRSTNP